MKTQSPSSRWPRPATSGKRSSMLAVPFTTGVLHDALPNYGIVLPNIGWQRNWVPWDLAHFLIVKTSSGLLRTKWL
jgi:hypothetical protein